MRPIAEMFAALAAELRAIGYRCMVDNDGIRITHYYGHSIIGAGINQRRQRDQLICWLNHRDGKGPHDLIVSLDDPNMLDTIIAFYGR